MKVKIIKRRSDLPKCVRKFKELKGIHIGKCIDKYGCISKEHVCHVHTASKYRGWICLRYRFQLKEKLTLLHEVAHLLVNPYAPPHGKEWKKAVVKIGELSNPFTILIME